MRNALGKGLARLMGEIQDEGVREIRIASIARNPNQPRQNFDEETIRELAESILSVGVLQPILVRPIDSQRYELVAGERRYRAAQIAGLESIPAVVRGLDDRQALQFALIENVQREDISALDAADAYRRLNVDFGLTQEEIAQAVGKSRPAVANSMRLLRLPAEVREALQSGTITEGHARALLQFDTETEMLVAFRRSLEKGTTVRDVERMSRGNRKHPAAQPTALEQALSERVGAPARITRKGRGGSIEISYFSEEELVAVLDRLDVSL